MEAYEHYVRQRHGADANHFTFDYGQARFFLLDTRTERRRCPDMELNDPDPNTRMIGEDQMDAFKGWLLKHSTEDWQRLKFVVSSVPFIAEVLPEHGYGDGERRMDRSVDKWSGAPFRRQR